MASFIRFRSGGDPGGTAGVCLSAYDADNYFIYGYDGDLIIRHTDAFTTTLDTGNQPNGTTSKTDIIKINTTSLNVNLPINTNRTITIDTNNTADFELLKFNTGRPWSFWNRGTDSSSFLELMCSGSSKNFKISNGNGYAFGVFYAHDTYSENYVSLSRLSVGPNLNTPQHTLDIENDINITGNYKINGSDLTTDNIVEGISKKYYDNALVNAHLESIFDYPLNKQGNENVKLLYNSSHFEVNTNNLEIHSGILSQMTTPWTTTGANISYSSGSVGIGTQSPTEKLDIHGNICFYSKAGLGQDHNQGILWGNNYHIRETAGSWNAPNYQQLEIKFPTGITLKTDNLYGKSFVGVDNAMSIGSSYYNTKPPNNSLVIQGNLGVGLTNPSYKLDVANGQVRLDNCIIGRLDTNVTNYTQFMYHNLENNSTNYALLQQATGATFLNASANQDINFRIGNG
ncbi:hypothetical protein T484DRAFT_3647360, partial [Baffinella frigidus]